LRSDTGLRSRWSTFGGRADGEQDKSTDQHLLEARGEFAAALRTDDADELILKSPRRGWGVPLFFKKSRCDAVRFALTSEMERMWKTSQCSGNWTRGAAARIGGRSGDFGCLLSDFCFTL
jgi:hypothetical protein